MPRRRAPAEPDASGGDGLDALFATPLPDFTRARNALAARLTAAGRADAARSVRAVEKPSAALWGVNQLARRAPEAVERVVRGVDRLKTGGDAPGRQALLAPAVARARELAEGAGVRVSPAMLERLSATLFAAAADPARRADLVAGRLREELALPGFEVFGGQAPAAPSRAGRAPRAEAAARRHARVDRARTGLQATRREARELEDRAAELERTADEARRTAEGAALAATRARDRAAQAAERVRAAEAALDAAARD
jgi:hypothetical protein